MTEEQTAIRQADIRSRAVHLARFVLVSSRIAEPAEKYLSSVLEATYSIVADGSNVDSYFSPVEHAPVFCALVRTLTHAVRVCCEMKLDSDTDDFATNEIEAIEELLGDFE